MNPSEPTMADHDPSTGTGGSASVMASRAASAVHVPPVKSKLAQDVKMEDVGQVLARSDKHRFRAPSVPAALADDDEDGSASPRSDRAVRDDSILPGGDHDVDHADDPNPETSSFGAGANDADLHRQASILRISLSPPPSAHVPPPEETDPEALAKLGPAGPTLTVKGAAAGEGEAGGVSREGVECEHDADGAQSDGDESTEPQVGSEDGGGKDTREKGPGPGTGGSDDHCGPSEGIGVGMPKDRPSKASTAKKGQGNSGGSDRSEGDSGRGSGSGSGSGSGGYDASASAESSAPPAANGPPADKASNSRSRSMAPEPEISPPKDERRSGSNDQPTASKPRKQPKEGEEGGGMLPPAAPASSGLHRIRGATRPHGKGRATGVEEDDLAATDGKNMARGQSSAGPDDSLAPAAHTAPGPSKRRHQHLAAPASPAPRTRESHQLAPSGTTLNSKVEMMDPRTMQLVNVARAPAVPSSIVPAINLGGAAKRQAEEMMSREEAEAEMAQAQPREGEEKMQVDVKKDGDQEVMRVDAARPPLAQLGSHAAQSQVRPSLPRSAGEHDSNEDTSGTDGWFRTLNYHYRPPPVDNQKAGASAGRRPSGSGGAGEESEGSPASGMEEGNGQRPKALWRRGNKGDSSDSVMDQDAATAEALRVIAARKRHQQQSQQQSPRSGSAMLRRTQSQEERLGMPGAEASSTALAWEHLPPHIRRVMMAQQLGRLGVAGGPIGMSSYTHSPGQQASPVAGPSRSPRHHHAHLPGSGQQRGRASGSPLPSGAEGMSSSMRSSSRKRLFGNDSDDNDATFREIVDDLTIQNKVLKSRLRRYEPAKQPRDMKKERLFEVRFFEGLAPDRRKELEGFLTAFVQSLYEPPEAYESAAVRSMSRSMPSVSAIHNSSDAERAQPSSGGETSEPHPPPMRKGLHEGLQGPPPPPKESEVNGSANGSGGAASGQPINKDSGYGSLASGNSAAGRSAPAKGEEEKATRANHEAQVQQQQQQRPRRSDQHRLAEASFSGYEPPSATGTGTGMKITPPHDNAASEWVEQPPQTSTKRKRDHDAFTEEYGHDAETIAKGRAVAAAVEKLFHDSMIALNGGAALGDVDPTPLPKEAGTNRAYLRNLLEGSGASGWIYLNLAFGMAQLHRFNVAIPFVKAALRQYGTSLELSVDGRKIRRRCPVDVPEAASDSNGTGSSIRKSSALDGSASDQTGSIPRAGTSLIPTEQSTAQTSIEPSKDGSSAIKGGSLDSAEGSQPIIRGPDYRLLTENKEGPAIKRLKTSHEKGPSESKSSSVYVPLFDHGADSDSTQESRFESSAHVSSKTTASEAQKRAVGEGTVSFFSGGMFCSDMSSEPPRIAERGSRKAEHYTIGLDNPTEPEILEPLEVKQFEHTYLRRPSVAFERALEKIGPADPLPDEAIDLRFVLGSLDESERATIELEALVSTGMTNMIISDNFSLIATMAYIAIEGERPTAKRKYAALDLSPASDIEAIVQKSKRSRGPGRYFTYRTLTERPISHLPSTRQRFLANPYPLDSDDDEYNDDSQASPESDHELSPPEAEPMQGVLHRGMSESPEGDYNLSLRLPFSWSRPQNWSEDDDDEDLPQPSLNRAGEPGAGGPFSLDLEGHRKISAPGPASSALATPSSEEGTTKHRGPFGRQPSTDPTAPMELDEGPA